MGITMQITITLTTGNDDFKEDDTTSDAVARHLRELARRIVQNGIGKLRRCSIATATPSAR